MPTNREPPPNAASPRPAPAADQKTDPSPFALFVGAEYEDNLSTRTLTAAARRAGFSAAFVRFNARVELPEIASHIVAAAPAFVGLSVAFQHRAAEFVALAAELRARGWRGHVCAGGHVATMMPEEVLAAPAVDTVLAHEAEDTLVALLRTLDDRAGWPAVPGLAWREDGRVRANPPAAACPDLDRLPLPVRDPTLRLNLGFGFAPLAGSRGCYGACRFCAIGSEHRRRPGPRLRFRSPASIAAEMAALYHEHAARIFCFHDETLFLRSERQTRARLDELADRLAAIGVTGIGVVGKTRPDAVSPALLAHLRQRLGLMRLYVGIENWSRRGAKHLGRGMDAEVAAASLEACGATGVYGCYNLLIFEPDATLDDVEENLRGVERFAAVPMNFCRAEAYAGTPLWHDLRRTGRLRTEGFATDYTIGDPRVQRLFELLHQAFRDRNFAPDGLANMMMSVGYESQILTHFAAPGDAIAAELSREVAAFVRDVNLDTLARLREALAFARSPGALERAATAEFTVELATRVNVSGAELHGRLLDLRRDLARHSARSPAHRAAAGAPAAARAPDA